MYYFCNCSQLLNVMTLFNSDSCLYYDVIQLFSLEFLAVLVVVVLQEETYMLSSDENFVMEYTCILKTAMVESFDASRFNFDLSFSKPVAEFQSKVYFDCTPELISLFSWIIDIPWIPICCDGTHLQVPF